MAKIFLTVVGVGEYEPTEYMLGGEGVKNRFVQKSLLTLLTQRGEKFDKIIFFLTDAAKKKHWENRITENKNDDETVDNEGLRPFLEKNYPGIYTSVDIKYGENEKEIFELFNTMYDAIGENDEITFDITHGFRFIPFLFFPLISYAKELKNVTIKNIYYGLFNKNKPSEIIDLQPYDEILDCANAAHNFIHSGNADEICAIVKAHSKKIPVEQKREFSPVNHVAKAISELTNALLTCHGGNDNYSIVKYADELQNKKKKINEGIDNATSLFTNLIVKAADSVSPLHDAETPYEFGMEAVKWYAERELFLQAYTALRETITTLFCCIYAPEYDYLSEIRKVVIDRIVTSYKINSSDDDRMREALDFGIDSENAVIFVKAIRHIAPDKMRFVGEIIESRNHMNHFGMNKTGRRIKKENLENLISDAQELIDDIEARRNEIISDEEARKILYTFRQGKGGKFINFSNHSSESWSEEQRDAAISSFGGEILDVPFPSVPAGISESEINEIAREFADKIASYEPSAVMCMGEFGVCFKVVELLKRNKIKVVYSCSERCAEEIVTESGTQKSSLFRFVRFREY